MEAYPRLIVIDHDNHYASHVGHTNRGLQFFLTTPFVPTVSEQELGREFVALFLFDQNGVLVDARIDDLGAREKLEPLSGEQVFHRRLQELGEIKYGRIIIEPFQVSRFGLIFGLVPRKNKNPDEGWYVTLEPGNYMSFHPPWNSGLYDT